MAEDRNNIGILRKDFSERNDDFIRIVSSMAEDGTMKIRIRHGRVHIEECSFHGKKD